MDKRYKAQPPEMQLKIRKALMDGIQQQPGRAWRHVVTQLRTELRLTIAEFSTLSGVSARTLAQIESGSGNPRIDTVEKLLKPFGLQLGVAHKSATSESDE